MKCAFLTFSCSWEASFLGVGLGGTLGYMPIITLTDHGYDFWSRELQRRLIRSAPPYPKPCTRNNGNNKPNKPDKSRQELKTHPIRNLLIAFMSNIIWRTFLVTTIVTFFIVVHTPPWITENLPAQSNLTWTDGKRQANRNNSNHAWSSAVPEHERNTTYLVHSLEAREISDVRSFFSVLRRVLTIDSFPVPSSG
jgi:hypothetical protein